MKWITTSEAMQGLERDLIERIGLPGICLMESAAKAVALDIHKHFPASARCGVVVVCGAGNNGGDGYAVARWLKSLGYPVSIWSLSSESKGDAGEMRAIASRCDIPAVTGLSGAALIVDAILGIGLTREVTGRYAEVIQSINQHPAPVAVRPRCTQWNHREYGPAPLAVQYVRCAPLHFNTLSRATSRNPERITAATPKSRS